MAKYKSRATRAADTAEEMNSAAEQLREIAFEIDGIKDEIEEIDAPLPDKDEGVAKLKARIAGLVKKAQEIEFDFSEVEALAEEMGSWRDNMQGTNLESTGKYSEVEEAADTLENIDTSPPDIENEDDVEELAEFLENAASELESVMFPSMY
jgi:chromosome segregation ATPase